MIQDLSQTLRAILTQPSLPTDLSAAQIVFDRPADTFNPSQTSVDLFLYDLRENLELRANESTLAHADGQVTIVPSPLRLACTYLVTAWPVGAGELALREHQLLGEVLQVLSQYPTIPASFLQGSLVGQDPPLPMIALHPDAINNVAEFWTSMGSRLRASLSVTVTISVPVFPSTTAREAITVQTGLQEIGAPATRDATVVIAGTVISAGAPVAAATVTLVELGLTATSDAAGHFRLGPMAAGSYTLRVLSDTTTKTKSIVVPAAVGSNYDVQLS
jgi:Pvc16 N-terminal domain/Carboxypeptidase regulatory-like domain